MIRNTATMTAARKAAASWPASLDDSAGYTWSFWSLAPAARNGAAAAWYARTAGGRAVFCKAAVVAGARQLLPRELDLNAGLEYSTFDAAEAHARSERWAGDSALEMADDVLPASALVMPERRFSPVKVREALELHRVDHVVPWEQMTGGHLAA